MEKVLESKLRKISETRTESAVILQSFQSLARFYEKQSHREENSYTSFEEEGKEKEGTNSTDVDDLLDFLLRKQTKKEREFSSEMDSGGDDTDEKEKVKLEKAIGSMLLSNYFASQNRITFDSSLDKITSSLNRDILTDYGSLSKKSLVNHHLNEEFCQ